VRGLVFTGAVEHVSDGILNIVDGSREWVLWSQTVFDVEHYITGDLGDVSTEIVVHAMQRDCEAGAAEVDQHGPGIPNSAALGDRLIKMGFDKTAVVAGRNFQHGVGLGLWERLEDVGECNEEAENRDEEFEAQIADQGQRISHWEGRDGFNGEGDALRGRSSGRRLKAAGC
jgi:hypothetical protein